MKDFKMLKLLDRFKGFFQKIGVDYEVMRKILQIKFTMDSRRTSVIVTNSSKQEDDSKDKSNFKKSLLVYGLMGIIMVPMVLMGKNYIYQMSIVFGILMFMLMTSLISDFSSVLLDIRDKNIISSKPVNSKTLSMAKIIHVLNYMIFITFSLSAPALVAALVKQGFLFFIIFLLEVIFMDLFIVILTALLYLIILKFFDGEKLKDIINYVQIGLTITISVGYQFLGRLFTFVHLDAVFTPKWWQYFIVPIWFGAPFEIIINGSNNTYFIAFSVLSIVIPIVSIIIYIKLIPTFERSLQKLNNNNEKKKKGNIRFLDTILKFICSTSEERTFFRFATNMMKNEREFKLKVYPSLGFALIFPFIFIFNSLRESSWSSIGSSKMYLNIYFCALLLPTIIMMMKYSGTYKGAWVYKVTPIKSMASIFRGTLKAFIINLLCPIYLVECVVFIYIFGGRILPDLLLVLLNILLFAVVCFRLMEKSLPFSQAFGATGQSKGLIAFVLMIFIGVLAGIHYTSTNFNYGVYVNIVVMIILVIFAWKKALSVSWDKLSNVD